VSDERRAARSLAGAFALVVVAEAAARALGVVYPAVLAAAPDWTGSSLVVGSALSFGVGVGGTSALFARWTGVEVRFGPPAPRAVAPFVVAPVAVVSLARVAGAETGLGPSVPARSLPLLLNAVVGPALVLAVGYGLLYAVVGERARAATPTRAPAVTALAGAVVVAVPLRGPVGLGPRAALAALVTGAAVVGVGASAAWLGRRGVVALVAVVAAGGVAAGVAAAPVAFRLVAVGCAAVGYHRSRTVVTPACVLGAFRLAAAA
jgi:hypothetical protein